MYVFIYSIHEIKLRWPNILTPSSLIYSENLNYLSLRYLAYRIFESLEVRELNVTRIHRRQFNSIQSKIRGHHLGQDNNNS